MKKTIFLFTLLIFLSTVSMKIDKGSSSYTNSEPELEYNQQFLKGTLTFKVKDGVVAHLGTDKCAVFNTPSLNSIFNQFKISYLNRRFRYNEKNLKPNMPDLSRIYRIEFSEEIPVSTVIKALIEDHNIEYAEPIPVLRLLDVPDDTYYGDLHHLHQIEAEKAWDIHKGENGPGDVVIAIVDTGIEWDHEDLVDNIWQNPGEDIDGDGCTIIFDGNQWIFDPDDENGIDDDGNGYIDDFIGWNFFEDSNNPIPNTLNPNWTHGTLMGGYASATTNNQIGVASISWNLKIMPLQGGFYSHSLGAYDAMIYAAENGADVISNSWGDYGWYSIAFHEVIDYVNSLGSIIVAGSANDDEFKNMYPASYPGVLAVAAVNQYDEKASYSNFGPHISISAPGGDAGSHLKTTDVGNSYCNASGTSCATPIVAGLLGLVKSYHPDWNNDQVITQVLGTAKDIDSINPGLENLMGAGRINAEWALDSSNVTLQQEIAIDILETDFHDTDGDHIANTGDTLMMNLKLINYKYGVCSDNAAFKLISDDPDISIIADSINYNIPADDIFVLDSVFQFIISEQAETHEAVLKLVISADKDIIWGDTLLIELLIAPTGILVFEGINEQINTFSGQYIMEYLLDIDTLSLPVFYTNKFPASLEGFSAAFLSFGNLGPRLHHGSVITMDKTETIKEYLQEGGRIYVECGSFFGVQLHYQYPNYQEVFELFGIAEAQYITPINSVSILSGSDGSCCEGLEFTGSSQTLNYFIDAMTVNETGVDALEEEGYGIVGAQNYGLLGQNTFCFSYAISLLEDGSQGTREQLMDSIFVFLFSHNPNVGIHEEQINYYDFNLKAYPNPFQDYLNISFHLHSPDEVILDMLNCEGKIVGSQKYRGLSSGQHYLSFSPGKLTVGMYLLRLRTKDNYETRKVLKIR